MSEKNNTLIELIQKVKELIADGQTGEAIKTFLYETQDSKELETVNTIILLISSRYREFEDRRNSGTLPLYDNSHQIIRKDFLELLNTIQKRINQEGQYKSLVSELTSKLIMATNFEQVSRTKFEIEKAMRKYPDDYEIFKLHSLLEENMDNIKGYHMSGNIFGFLSLGLIVDLIDKLDQSDKIVPRYKENFLDKEVPAVKKSIKEKIFECLIWIFVISLWIYLIFYID